MEHVEDYAVFDEFPEPVFTQQDGRIRYQNKAASKLFCEKRVGDEIPEGLLSLERGKATAVEIEGRPYAVTVAEDGALIVLRPAALPISLATLVNQMRQKMNNLVAAATLLAPVVEGSTEESAMRHLATLNQGLYRMLRLVGDLDLAGQGRSDCSDAYYPASIDLADFFETLAREVEPMAEAVKVTFTYECTVPLLLTVGDGALLHRMVLALLSNAFRAVGQEGRVVLKLERSGKNALITMRDNGPGLTSAQLFGYFDGGGECIQEPQNGLGLGLPIVRYITRLHGGVIMVESREGSGLCAMISLPVRSAKETTLRAVPTYYDATGGFSSLLVELSDALPWQVFLPEDLE